MVERGHVGDVTITRKSADAADGGSSQQPNSAPCTVVTVVALSAEGGPPGLLGVHRVKWVAREWVLEGEKALADAMASRTMDCDQHNREQKPGGHSTARRDDIGKRGSTVIHDVYGGDRKTLDCSGWRRRKTRATLRRGRLRWKTLRRRRRQRRRLRRRWRRRRRRQTPCMRAPALTDLFLDA